MSNNFNAYLMAPHDTGFIGHDVGSIWSDIGHGLAAVAKPLASVASAIPGLGTIPAMALNAAAAIGNGESLANVAISAAVGAVPGGPAMQSVLKTGIGLAKGGSVSGALMNMVRDNVPGGAVGKAVFDGGVALGAGATKGQWGDAIARLGSPAAQQVMAKIGLAAGIGGAGKIGAQAIGSALANVGAKVGGAVAGGAAPTGVAPGKMSIGELFALARAAEQLKNAPPAATTASTLRPPTMRTPPRVVLKVPTPAPKPAAPPAPVSRPPTMRTPPRVIVLHGTPTATPSRAFVLFRRPRPLSYRAQAFVMKAARSSRETRGIDEGGATYTVEKNDSAWKIAQALTMNGNAHWKELLMANRQKNVGPAGGPFRLLKSGEVPQNNWNFQYLKVGEKLTVPQAWRDAAKAEMERRAKEKGQAPPAPPPAAPPTPAQAAESPTATTLPKPGTTTPTTPKPDVSVNLPPVKPVVSQTATPEARDDAQAVAQAKLILAAWETTDGAGSAGLLDYGQTSADQSPIWGPRDTYELRSFVQWSNKRGGAQLDEQGDLTQSKLDALVKWAEQKGISTAPVSGPAPVNPYAPAAAQTPAISVVTGGGGGAPVPQVAPAMPVQAPPVPVTPVGPSEPIVPAPVPVTSMAGMSGGSSAPTPVTMSETIPETLITGKPKSDSDFWLLAALGAGALVVAATSKPKRRRAA